MSDINEQLAAAMGESQTEESTEVVDENLEQTEVIAGDENLEPAGEDIRGFGDWVEDNELDAEYMYGLEIGMGDGSDPVPLGKMKDRYVEAQGKNTQYQEQLQQQQARINELEQYSQYGQQLDQNIQSASAQVQAIQQQYQATNWEEMERNDPARAALQRQKFQEAFSGASQQLEQVKQQSTQQAEGMRQQRLQQGQQYLTQHIPEWNNAEVARSDRQEIARMMVAEGYPPEAVGQMSDPIAVRLAHEFLKMRKQLAAGGKAAKQVAASPKRSLRGGRGKVNAGVADKLTQRAQSTRQRGDQIAAVKALLG